MDTIGILIGGCILGIGIGISIWALCEIMLGPNDPDEIDL